MKSYYRARDGFVLVMLAIAGMLIQGYHTGVEDDGVYLSAIQYDLDPRLYSHDAAFFRVQLQATVFDKLVAASIRITHLPTAWVILLWQFASILLILWGCLRIARLCFDEPGAQWAGVALVAALLTLPAAGTGLYIADEHLHPRALATGCILAAVVAVMERRPWLASCLLLVTLMMHPIMACFGISYCLFLWFGNGQLRVPSAARRFLSVPLGWIFEPVTPAWRQAAATRRFYVLTRWTWYEWIGVVAPMLLLWWFGRLAEGNGNRALARMSRALNRYAAFQLALAAFVTIPESLERLRPLQPMRYLHLVYLLLALLGGGLVGQTILRGKVYRWLLLFVPLCAGMSIVQRQIYAGTEHLELPGRASANPWLQAFAWIRNNTGRDAYFAIDPHYLELPGESFHSFRALAARSVLADAVKDTSVVTQVPELGARWQKETAAASGWRYFEDSDFKALQRVFGVNWILVYRSTKVSFFCPYQNELLKVCRLQ